ncbi:uncharacterized protein si:ch211-154o6.3 [Etheostoma spectabile]|uniref:uncharacterized protein si:ch211-154o6.3 n=1 Tax=Etheostoma spectabile TaxID=54343 RepID=UPI0013AF770D|nr:uncharacterized protein LOC116690815 [Etheostoma spectabile]
MGEVRKLQKKLRQIGNLEIKISLTSEERLKISRKAELRSRLAELQLQLSGPQQTLGIVGDGKKEKMKRQVEDALALPIKNSPSTSKIKGREGLQMNFSPIFLKYVSASPSLSDIFVFLPPRDLGEILAFIHPFKFAFFHLSFLSNSLSTLFYSSLYLLHFSPFPKPRYNVKMWPSPNGPKPGGTWGVTCLSAPPPEYCKRLARSLSLSDKERFILSGSADCYVKIWALSIGQCVKSIYTFNAVTALCFLPEEEGYFITGSDGGKVQAWSWQTFDNCQSINAHQEAVTSIQSQGPLVFSGSAEGGVSVWENRCSDRDPLRLLHHWGEQVTGCGGGSGGHLNLSPRGDRVFLSYGRAWLKILHWRTGTMSRLTNHNSITGVTDCVHQTGGLLIGSCYDLANGESSLNLFSLPQCQYLASLSWPDAPRILCFTAWATGSGDHRWVTGGHDLIVWEQLPSSGKQRGDVTVKRDSRLESCSLESEGDTEDDEETDDYEDDDDNAEGKDIAEDGGSGSWLRCILQ